jgi:hypothetical protein
MQGLTKEEEAAKAAALEQIQTCNETKKMLVKLSMDTAEIDQKININHRLLSILVYDTHGLPTNMVILPVLKRGFKKYDPMNLCRDQGKLFFICPVTKRLVKSGKDEKGYDVITIKPWVKDALPILKVGLMLLQVGLLASGLPIPIVGLADSVLGRSDKLSFLQAAVGLLRGNVSLDSLDSALDSVVAEDKVSAAIRDLQAGESSSDIRCAYKAIDGYLREKDPNLLFLGMVKAISRSGRVAWVEDNPAVIKHFMEHEDKDYSGP